MKVNTFDERKDGFDSSESLEACKLLDKVGIDSIQVTRPLSPLYFTKKLSGEKELIDYSNRLIKSMDALVIVGGGFNKMDYMNEILNSTEIEYMSMYRPFVCENDFLKSWKIGNSNESRCLMCNNCYRTKKSTCYHF